MMSSKHATRRKLDCHATTRPPTKKMKVAVFTPKVRKMQGTHIFQQRVRGNAYDSHYHCRSNISNNRGTGEGTHDTDNSNYKRHGDTDENSIARNDRNSPVELNDAGVGVQQVVERVRNELFMSEEPEEPKLDD